MCLIMSSMWAFVAVSIYINIFLIMIHFTTFGMHKISLWLVLKKILPTYNNRSPLEIYMKSTRLPQQLNPAMKYIVT